ncbi:MAG: hypothetical protein ACOYXA_05025 [Bacteroidota bacterium]
MRCSLLKSLCLLLLYAFPPGLRAQNLKVEVVPTTFYRLPLKKLNPDLKTWSLHIQDIGGGVSRQQYEYLDSQIKWPGFERVATQPDVLVELVVAPLSVTSKEVKDVPLETTQNGNKVTVHQYWYQITYSYLMKLRLSAGGQLIAEQDFGSAAYGAEYYPQDRNSKLSLEKEWANDQYFLPKQRAEKVEQIANAIRQWLFSHYGYGFASEEFNVGYVKDKDGRYADLSEAMARFREALLYAKGKEHYLDDQYKSLSDQSVAIWKAALQEASNEKKARINPKVTEMIWQNLVLTAYAAQQYDVVEQYFAEMPTPDNSMRLFQANINASIADKKLRASSTTVTLASPVVTSSAGANVTRDYLVDRKGDTVFVKIILPPASTMPHGDSVWMQEKVMVWEDGRQVTLLPTDIIAYSYQGKCYETYTWVDFQDKNPTSRTKGMFVKRVVNGAIPLYVGYTPKSSSTDPTKIWIEKSTFYKADGAITTAGFLNFKKGVSKLVANHTGLVAKVQNGEYGREDFVTIIQEYNQWVKSQSK